MLTSSKSEFANAKKREQTTHALIRERSVAGAGAPKGLELDQNIRRSIRPGYYEHFKSSKSQPKFYHVFKVLSHVNYELDSHAYQVEYAALYYPHAGRETLREILGEDGFLTPVWREEYIGPRFVYRGKSLAKGKLRSSYQ